MQNPPEPVISKILAFVCFIFPLDLEKFKLIFEFLKNKS